MENKNRGVSFKNQFMKKGILFFAAVLAGHFLFAQQKTEKPPPPPPPKVIDVKEVIPPPPPPPPPKATPKKVDLPEDHHAFLNRNPTVKSISWSEDKISIRLKSGKEEEYLLNNDEEMQKLKDKYGELPASPPKVIKEKN